MENLAYWKLRTVEARNEDFEERSDQSQEELVFCRMMVAMIEVELFEREEA